MTATVAQPARPPAAPAPPPDPRLAAFCDRGSPEVFHSVATPTELWKADPFDVDTIHAPAREAYERLLHRAARVPAPPAGAVLVLLGEAGSGKTHLMRAFRTRAHSQALGYCGYMQMTTEVGSYPRYMLHNLIDGLEAPYSPDGPSRTGLARLSAALLELVPGLDPAGVAAFRESEGDDAATLADEFADRLAGRERFAGCDLELLRVVLHLRRDDPRVRNRALMWLRCQEMRPADRGWIGGAVPRADDEDPNRMLAALARLTDAVHGVPLVLLVDQLEDMANLSAPVERFRKVVDAVTAFTDQVPNAVVVMACLEDYFKENIQQVRGSKKDRLERDPEPIRLAANRTLDDIRAMVARRLAHLYAEKGVDADPAHDLFPFRNEHLAPLGNLRTRDVLDFLRRHHERCILAGAWVEPPTPGPGPGPGRPEPPVLSPPPPPASDLDQLWNDFHSAHKAVVPDDEDDLTAALADAVRACSAELPDGVHFGDPRPAGRFIEVETHKPGNAVDKLLVAVCNRGAQGNGLKNQLDEVEKRLGEFPVAIVRTIDFPKTGKAMTQIAGMLKRDGRRVVVENADWRRMLAFEAFRRQHSARPDFPGWQRAARPLGELKSLQDILRLRALLAAAPATPATQPPPAAPAPAPRPIAADPVPTPAGQLRLGVTAGRMPALVTVDPLELTMHAAFLGAAGSGKTTAALNLIEQLLARGVPAVLVDRKGDLCRYADPAAWDRPLTDPGREAARRALRDKLDVAVYTPGEPRGRPLALPVVPAGFAELPEADRELFAQYAAAALGSMMAFKGTDADRQQQAVLAKAIEVLAADPGSEVNVPALRQLVEDQDDGLLAAVGGFDGKVYQKLADRLLTLWLNNKALLSGGEVLDVDALLGTGPHARPGRVRLSVVSTRFLADPARLDFWVAQLLVAVGRWCGRSPSPRLQAVVLFDEADVYLPAGTRQPATKAPMENLLKRARSAGVGVFLATQSPGDLDYKCKENVRSWLLGRVKEPRALEKLKPMLAAGRADAADKLAGQGAGEFHLVRESEVTAVRSDESFVRTEQVPEDRIAELARAGRAVQG